jgi:hypothetical protein
MWEFLSTVNGFDLLLVIIIVSLIIRVRLLNHECESYVRQIMKASWEIQSLKKGGE